MIAQIFGKIIKKCESSVYIETESGIVFEVICPQYSLEKSFQENSKIRIHTYLYVREDQMTLFGFYDESELRLFKYLISVSDIGPKKAISILSKESYQTIINAIADSDIRFLSSVPGIGRKTAEKIVLELKEKLSELRTASVSSENRLDQSVQAELYSALINLGYKPNQAEKAIANLKNVGNNDFNVLFKEALNIIKSV
ncbi:MAG: Holliday junction branch migration protein RuvA [Deltaproteobacteria bacterium]|nr:Holliday junction branch migration protein RuvA [Deltaproteobacteria bacterium]